MKKNRKLQKQIAALPYRRHGKGVDVLLITSRETRRWVIPKGWPMKGKKDWNAAAREAFEEAGVEGKVGKKSIGRYVYNKRLPSGKLMPTEVTVYPMDVIIILGQWPEKPERRRKWMSAAEAAELVEEESLKAIIEATLV
jgi:8-oxo-dGTP pyrophosphatase MutT (NUDIX family)